MCRARLTRIPFAPLEFRLGITDVDYYSGRLSSFGVFRAQLNIERLFLLLL